jgi:putative SOS response-associated peptidase YedK
MHRCSLRGEPADTERLKAMLKHYPPEGLAMWPVSKRVGNVKNNDPSLIEAVA